jgi:ethanolamine utilization protein EutA
MRHVDRLPPDGATVAWEYDNVELTTVGIDIGSATSHLVFARLRLRRFAEGLSSRFAVVSREVIGRSPIRLTPYRPDGLIDVEALREFVEDAYSAAGMRRGDVDTGAVILTGVALERANARRVAELFAEEGGRFVCASAGHGLEAMLAAHGSGAVAASVGRSCHVVHVDIGGGTSKICRIRNGVILESVAVAVGGRLLVVDENERLIRLEPAAAAVLRHLGADAVVGDVIGRELRRRIADCMAGVLLQVICGMTETRLTAGLRLTPPLRALSEQPPDLLTLSGGVAEFRYSGGEGPRDDLGRDLLDAFVRGATEAGIPMPDRPLTEGIRATVVGASQFTVQVSGNTIDVLPSHLLPLRGLPVVRPAVGPEEHDSAVLAEAIKAALRRLDLTDGQTGLAVALPWMGPPSHAALRSIAHGVLRALPRSVTGSVPLVLVTASDLGQSLGAVLAEECPKRRNVFVLDGLQLFELDFVDVGEVLRPAGVVPVVVKSLAFATDSDPEGE